MNIPKPMHPRPDKKRTNWQNLNGPWQFSFDEPIFDKTITVPFSWAAPLSGIHEEDKTGKGFYRKVVRYTPTLAKLFLIIGASDYTTEVYVNGEKLATHQGGYAPIEVEVTSVWNKNGDNEIIVIAEDLDNKDYQTYGKQGYGNIRGIWQTVYLEERPASYIDHVVIRTECSGKVTFDFETVGEFDLLEATFGGITVWGKDNHLELTIAEPKLWSPDEPNLYEGTLRLHKDGVVDVVESYFGIREVGTIKCENGCRYVTLNGKPIYINSTLDQSFNPWGFFTLPTNEEEETEILRMKKLGLNSARIHIKTEEPLKLYYADKHGLMIIQDIPCFWGEPNEKARTLFDEQMVECMRRDINHPAIVHWVLYNETWGLFTGDRTDAKNRSYTKETQEWVRKNYHLAKAMDPTRLVEDNSPCNYDHVETDINTWHFYSNGYGPVKEVISSFAEKSFVGSTFNYTEGNTMADVPLMNSECGNVWGIDGNAGDSDMAWHYHYMINQFRLTEKLCGFVFTEFHDVINEFNGYYRIDNSEKIFGYDAYVPGMSMVDLHAQDFLACDMAPMTTVKAGETISLPLFISSFTDENHGKDMLVRAELWYTDGDGAEHFGDSKLLTVSWNAYGLTSLGKVTFAAPNQDAVAVVRLYLETACGKIVMRNFVCFDVADSAKGVVVSLKEGRTEGDAILCQKGEKLNLLGTGKVYFDVELGDLDASKGLELVFEASAREEFSHDHPENLRDDVRDANYMLGYKVDRGENKNCYYMTDETPYPTNLVVTVNDKIMKTQLADAPADARGCLSWHYQENDRKLDEAGSYGYLVSMMIPADSVGEDKTLKIEMQSDCGFALYGRKSGRYPTGLRVVARG